MATRAASLPQLGEQLFLTDGGIETTLIFLEDLDLPDFAAFDLLRTPEGGSVLRRYFRSYADIARRHGTGLVLESATWRASADWGRRLDYTAEQLREANTQAVRLLHEVRDDYPDVPAVISGCIGPRGDGYNPSTRMTADEAHAYHADQVTAFAGAGVDLVTAITMNYVEEAVGVTTAARAAGLPVVISFTVETDGRLPTGELLGAAIGAVDAATDGYPAYYMINCAHPSHFDGVLPADASWITRVRGLRANASRLSHAELNEAPELDDGNPEEFGQQYADLRSRLPHLNILGGCCGTDTRHIDEVASACLRGGH